MEAQGADFGLDGWKSSGVPVEVLCIYSKEIFKKVQSVWLNVDLLPWSLTAEDG